MPTLDTGELSLESSDAYPHLIFEYWSTMMLACVVYVES